MNVGHGQGLPRTKWQMGRTKAKLVGASKKTEQYKKKKENN